MEGILEDKENINTEPSWKYESMTGLVGGEYESHLSWKGYHKEL